MASGFTVVSSVKPVPLQGIEVITHVKDASDIQEIYSYLAQMFVVGNPALFLASQVQPEPPEDALQYRAGALMKDRKINLYEHLFHLIMECDSIYQVLLHLVEYTR